jgi:WD40 repeat protein
MTSAEQSDQEPWLSARPGGVGVVISWGDGTGVRLASSGTDGTIRIWDPEAGTAVGAPLIGHQAVVWALSQWTDGAGHSRLASAGEDATVRIWDPDAATPVGDPLTGHVGWVPAITSWTDSRGGARIASAGNDGTVRVWDADNRTSIGVVLGGPGGPLWAIADWAGADGVRRVAAAGDDGKVLVWEAESGLRLDAELTTEGPGVWAMAQWAGPDDEPRLAGAATDGVIHVWNPETGARICRLIGHTSVAAALTVWRQGNKVYLASAAADGTIRLWDPEIGAQYGDPLPARAGFQANVTSWVTPSGSVLLASAGGDGAIRIWDTDTRAEVGDPLVGHTAALWALTSWLASDGSARLASGGDDTLVRLWNADTGAQLDEPLAGHTAGVWALTTWVTGRGVTCLASAGDDAVVRIWDADTGAGLRELRGHQGWVPALAHWVAPNGAGRLASAGVDGTVRIWDPETGEALETRRDHPEWVLALTTWRAEDGTTRLASAGHDRTIRIWDADTGQPVGQPLEGHTDGVRALATWAGSDGRTRLASSGYDGTVRIWDPDRSSPIGEPLTAHGANVGALASWVGADGRPWLASAGDDRVIRVWDTETGDPVGDPFEGHTGGIWALTSWSVPGGGTRLASAGYDGTVRLWDAETGRPMRTIEVGPVTLWGLSDAPALQDAIGRQVLADAIADQLVRPGELEGGRDGPTVVSVEGPWGSGKTTLMELVRQRLPVVLPSRQRSPGRLTVREAVRRIAEASSSMPHTSAPRSPRRGIITAWFNPWAHEAGEQVWAGLTYEIIDAAAAVLYPTEAERERYWFERNLRRVDRYAVRQTLLRRVISPWLGVALAAVVVPLVLVLAENDGSLGALGYQVTMRNAAAILAALSLALGVVHTLVRYWWGAVARYLPGQLLNGPVTGGAAVDGVDGQPVAGLADPLLRARAGSLYLHQHDVTDLLADLDDAGYQMVIFVDDVDRCRASTVADVFEAVNLFLSGIATTPAMSARFVIGLDPAMVVSRLDVPVAPEDAGAARLTDHPAWAFLRKLIQLPVLVPQLSDSGLQRFVDSALGPKRLPPAPAAGAGKMPRLAERRPPPPAASAGPDEGRGRRATASSAASAVAPSGQRRLAVQTLPRWSMEQHPEVRSLITARLSAQPDRSLREAKRMLNVWQLYERVLTTTDPLADTASQIRRARTLVILAEIITRWPMLQRVLHQRVDGRRGLQMLAEAARDDEVWQRTVQHLWPDRTDDSTALADLRHLLRDYEGEAVADLAARIL